jgi:hypothetical protein
MRVVLFLVAMATIVSISEGSKSFITNGQCSSSVSKVCAYCQDVNTRCAICKPGYQCLGSKASNCYCSANAASACPAAASNCLSCSALCPGTGTAFLSMAACAKSWNTQWGCSVCQNGFVPTQTLIPIPAGVPKPSKSCGMVNVTTCAVKSG